MTGLASATLPQMMMSAPSSRPKSFSHLKSKYYLGTLTFDDAPGSKVHVCAHDRLPFRIQECCCICLQADLVVLAVQVRWQIIGLRQLSPDLVSKVIAVHISDLQIITLFGNECLNLFRQATWIQSTTIDDDFDSLFVEHACQARQIYDCFIHTY